MTEELEHWADFTEGQERQGHQFSDVPIKLQIFDRTL